MFTVESSEVKIYACRLFEKRFNFAHGNKQSIAHKNVTLTAKNRSYYFYKIAPDNKWSSSGGGKDMKSLQLEAVANLKSFLTHQFSKRDKYRPTHGVLNASQVRMHLSRINDPLKKFNNDKGDVQLKNHANSLRILGRDWTNDFVSDQYYMIDLVSLQSYKSFIKKSKDTAAHTCDFNHILS